MARTSGPGSACVLRGKPARWAASGIESAVEMLGDLHPGIRLLGVNQGQFSLIDLIEATLLETGPADVTIATWSASARDLERLQWMSEEGLARTVRLLIDRSWPKLKPDWCAVAMLAFGPDAIRLTSSHARFALLGNDTWTIAIRTSMNLTRNVRMEQFDLDDDPAIYGWFERLVDHCFDCQRPGPDVLDSEIWETFRTALDRASRDRVSVAPGDALFGGDPGEDWL